MDRTIILSILCFFMIALSSCNHKESKTGEDFIRISEEMGFKVEQRVGGKDSEIGISAKYVARDSTCEVMFFELTNEEMAKQMFKNFSSDLETNHQVASAITYGSPNNSGVFGNTQEFFSMGISQFIFLIRVGNTIAFSM